MTYTHDEIMALDADALRLAIAEARKMFIPSLTTDEWSIAVDHGMVPDWPNDLAAAWELVEEVERANQGHWSMGYDNGVYSVFLAHIEITDVGYMAAQRITSKANGETMEIAICRAWLMWKVGQ